MRYATSRLVAGSTTCSIRKLGPGPRIEDLRRVRPRLLLGLRQDGGIPGFGLELAGFVQREAGVVAQLRAGYAVDFVFLPRVRQPFTGQIHRRVGPRPGILRPQQVSAQQRGDEHRQRRSGSL